MGRQLSRQKCIHESLHLSSRMDQVMGRGQCNLRAEGQKNLRSSMPGQSFQNNELKFIGRPCLKNIYISWGSIKKRHSDFNLGFHVSTTQQISNKHEKKKSITKMSWPRRRKIPVGHKFMEILLSNINKEKKMTITTIICSCRSLGYH